MDKESFRKGLRQRRRAHEPDCSIGMRLCELPEFERAQVVLTYLGFGHEVPTTGVIEAAWQQGKVVALPRCAGPHQLEWYEVASLDDLELSSFGMREPRPSPTARIDPRSCGSQTLAVVPGLCFDEEGYRIGYGGGYYDAFLGTFGGTTVGLCADAFLVPSLHELAMVEAHDVPVGVVLTDTRAIYVSQALPK